MTGFRHPDETISSSRRVMEKVIYDYCSDFFDSHVHLPPCHQREDGYVAPAILTSEVRRAIKSVKSRTAPGTDRIRSERVKNYYLSYSTPWQGGRTVLPYKKGVPNNIGIYRPIYLLSVVYSFTDISCEYFSMGLNEY